jgi:outer membrane protein TolC
MRYINDFTVFIVLIYCLLANSPVQAQETLSRRSLAQRAINESFVVKNQKNQMRITQIDKRKLYQTYLPNVSFNMSYTRLNDEIRFGIPPISLPLAPGKVLSLTLDPITLQEKELFKTDLTGSMVLFSGLKVPLALNGLQHKLKAEEAIVRKEEVSIIKDLADYYDRLALIDQSLLVLGQSEERLNHESAFARKAFKEGLVGAYDLSKIDIVIQELEARKIELSLNRKMVLSKLNQLTGIPKDSLGLLHPQLQAIVLDTSLNTPSSRPEILALNERIAAGQVKTKMSLTAYLPTVYAFGKKEMRTEDLSALEPQWYAGIGLKWSIFDGGMAYREYQKARIDEDMAQNELKNANKLFDLALEKSKNDAELSAELIKVANKRVSTAQKGLELITRQYQLGLSTITERLAAEADLQKAQLDLLQSIYNQRVAALAVLEANGKLTVGIL